jgi:hypothetical protein
MKFSKKDLRLLLPVLALLILAGSYWFGARAGAAETNALRVEIAELQARLETLKTHAKNTELYEERSKTAEAAVAAETARYPAAARPEDMIMFAVAIEEDVGAVTSSLSFATPRLIGELDLKTDAESAAITHFAAYATDMTVSFKSSYRQLKETLDYIRSAPEKAVTESLSVSYDSSDGGLTGSLTLSKVYLDDGAGAYTPTKVPGGPVGTDNPFGTIERGD